MSTTATVVSGVAIGGCVVSAVAIVVYRVRQRRALLTVMTADPDRSPE